jgi:putative ABC transport system permease protein
MWKQVQRVFGPNPKVDVQDELSFHLEMRIRELIERGESPERARELAMRRFGDYDESRRECEAIDERRGRRMVRTEYMTELRQDIGYAVRTLRRTPGFTAVAVATLALGIGANSAIFTVVHGVLLESLPFRDAERLHHVRMLYPDGTTYLSVSAPDFISVREENRVFEQVEAYATGILTMLGNGEPREIRGASVSDGLLPMLGVPVALGRGFAPEENQAGRNGVVVLDSGFWRREFGGDPAVLGRSVVLGGERYSIVGVLAPGAQLPERADVLRPLLYDSTFNATTATGRRSEFLEAIGRAKAGITAQQVGDDLRRLGAELQTRFPNTNGGLTLNAIRLQDLMVGAVRAPLFVLLGAVGFVLLVACANVANLLLARASARRAELAVRVALGAGRGRLLRQLLTESLVLGLAGGAAGLAIAFWGTRALVAAKPADIPRLENVSLDSTVALFTLATALLTSLAFGILPALQSTRGRITESLREGGHGGAAGRRSQGLRAALVVAEMALAVVLLTGAGLLIRSFVELTRVNTGFATEHTMAFGITMQGGAYKQGQQVRDRVPEFEQRLRALPGVTAVAATTTLPLSGLGAMIDFAVDGAPPPPPDVNQEIAVASVTPDYFRTIGIPLRRGRLFTDRDRNDAPLVAIINEAAIRRWFPNQDPIGRRVNLSGRTYDVVGVVADVLQRNPGEPAAPQLFMAYAQRTTRSIRMVVRTAGDPLALVSSVRSEIRAIDPNLAIAEFTPLDQLVARSVARPRFYTALLALFAGVALALAATGIFGVMSYAVAQRAREISIRMALGARTGNVLLMIVGRAVALAALGLSIGIAVALALGRVIRQQLFGVPLVDPITLGVVVLVLIASATIASLVPARRAAGLDPGTALRGS